MAGRVSAISKPGSLLKPDLRAARPKLKVTSRSPRERDEAHLAAIRKLACLKCAALPCGEAAHVRMPSGAHGKKSGMGMKPDDSWSLPLCHHCHMEQHKIGEARFWHDLGISPILLCVELSAVSPDHEKMAWVCLRARA
jgi:hypothetical protein